MTYMSMQWGNRRWLRILAFVSIGLAALYLGLAQPLQRSAPAKQVQSSATALLTMANAPASWMELRSRNRLQEEVRNGEPRVVAGIVGGVPGGVAAGSMGGIRHALHIVTPDVRTPDRMIIRTGSLTLVVAHPAQSVDAVARIAQTHGGYVVSSQVSGQKELESGQITVRIPAAQFDAVRGELKKVAKTVDTEQVAADDVTMQYSEDEATLRNYRAEESSYLEIMKRSGRIKDTLEVAEQLSDVRGRIERMAASLRTMQHESEMTALSVSLHTEPITVANEWRPLYQLKLAWNEGMDALADYATTMMAVLLRLPAVFAWIITLVIGAKLGWMLLLFGSRMFRAPKPEPSAS